MTAAVRQIGGSVIVALISLWPIAAKPAMLSNRSAYIGTDRLVDIGDRVMHIRCLGHGSPVVVFEAGAGGWSGDWLDVQPEVAKFTRTCSYDRAGMGFSDPSNKPVNSANIVDDLRHLLTAANERPPYILVGHSFGGHTVRLYADLHLREVIGMVLVDVRHEDQKQHQDAEFPGLWKDVDEDGKRSGQQCYEAALRGSGECPFHGEFANKPGFWASLISQGKEMGRSDDQVRAARRSYGTMPLIVLAATKAWDDMLKLPPEGIEKFKALSLDLNRDLASQSKRGALITVESGHYIQREKPAAVINAIIEILKTTRPITNE